MLLKKNVFFSVPQKDENILMKNPQNKNDNSPESVSVISSNSSSMKQLKLGTLFRTVSVPDEQVPGLNHLVNRPQSWDPKPRSKRPTKGIYFQVIVIYLYINESRLTINLSLQYCNLRSIMCDLGRGG